MTNIIPEDERPHVDYHRLYRVSLFDAQLDAAQEAHVRLCDRCRRYKRYLLPDVELMMLVALMAGQSRHSEHAQQHLDQGCPGCLRKVRSPWLRSLGAKLANKQMTVNQVHRQLVQRTFSIDYLFDEYQWDNPLIGPPPVAMKVTMASGSIWDDPLLQMHLWSTTEGRLRLAVSTLDRQRVGRQIAIELYPHPDRALPVVSRLDPLEGVTQPPNSLRIPGEPYVTRIMLQDDADWAAAVVDFGFFPEIRPSLGNRLSLLVADTCLY